MVLQDVKKVCFVWVISTKKWKHQGHILTPKYIYCCLLGHLFAFWNVCATKAAGATMAGMAMTILIFGSYHDFVLLITSSAQEACNTKSKVKVKTLINVLVINQVCRLVNFQRAWAFQFQASPKLLSMLFNIWLVQEATRSSLNDKFPGKNTYAPRLCSLNKG